MLRRSTTSALFAESRQGCVCLRFGLLLFCRVHRNFNGCADLHPAHRAEHDTARTVELRNTEKFALQPHDLRPYDPAAVGASVLYSARHRFVTVRSTPSAIPCPRKAAEGSGHLPVVAQLSAHGVHLAAKPVCKWLPRGARGGYSGPSVRGRATREGRDVEAPAAEIPRCANHHVAHDASAYEDGRAPTVDQELCQAQPFPNDRVQHHPVHRCGHPCAAAPSRDLQACGRA